MKMKTLKVIATVLVWVVMFGQLMPMTLMVEPVHPWYMPYTTIWFLVSAFLFYPPNALAALVLEAPVHGVIHWLANVGYAVLLTWLIWLAHPLRKSRTGMNASEKNNAL